MKLNQKELDSFLEDDQEPIPSNWIDPEMRELIDQLSILAHHEFAHDVTALELWELQWMTEAANMAAKAVSGIFYDLKNHLLQVMIETYPEAIEVAYSWNMNCVHVKSQEYGETCYHTNTHIPYSFPDAEWNGVGRQSLALQWAKLTTYQKRWVVKGSLDRKYATHVNRMYIMYGLPVYSI